MLAAFIQKSRQTLLINIGSSLFCALAITTFSNPDNFFIPAFLDKNTYSYLILFCSLLIIAIIQLNFWWVLKQKGIVYKWFRIGPSFLLATNIIFCIPGIYLVMFIWTWPIFVYHFVKEILSFRGYVLRKKVVYIYLLSLIATTTYEILMLDYLDVNYFKLYHSISIFLWLMLTNIVPQFIRLKSDAELEMEMNDE